MSYPKVLVNLKHIEDNAKNMVRIAKEKSGCTTLALVTKGHCSDKEVIKVLARVSGVDYLADARTQNIRSYFTSLGDGDEERGRKALQDSGKGTMLLRIPMKSELTEVVDLVDLCQISEIETIRLLNDYAEKAEKVQDILLMIDMGDLREGLFFNDREKILKTAGEIIELRNIKLRGISVNMNCYGAIIPKEDNLTEFVNIARDIERKYDVTLDIISGGNSGTIYLAEDGRLPRGITNIRIGEGYLQGTESSYAGKVAGAKQDAFIIQAEIVEIQVKPSIPIGESGLDAFGHVPHYEDKGDMKRAIIAVGKQDTELDSMTPLDEKIEIIGASSDHTILDITSSDTDYKVGDIVSFRLGYSGMLRAMTSPYVTREYI